MDYEKKYKEALELARDYHEDKNCFEYLKGVLKNIFPELQDSEDERIRKALIRYHKSTIDVDGIKGEDILAWLEKQGEQKETLCDKCRKAQPSHSCQDITALGRCYIDDINTSNKIKPQFHEGDWVVANACTRYRAKIYAFIGKGTVEFEDGTFEAEESLLKDYHLWTIQDAKDSDVLAAADWVFIFRKFHINGFPKCYCHYDLTLDEFKIDTDSYMASGGDIYPATKEQRDILFKKMKEAGYDWDDEKKELRKIEQSELTEFEDAVKDMMNAYRDAIGDNDATTEEIKKHASYMLSLISNKPAEWTDEDECYMGECISAISTKDGWSLEEKRRAKHWLQSIKQRMEE